MHGRLVRCALAGTVLALLTSAVARAQDTAEQPHDMSQMDMSQSGWMFMQDGTFNALFNHQGGPRGGDELKAPNWWMGMLSRPFGPGQLTLNGMFSVDPVTAGSLAIVRSFRLAKRSTDDRMSIISIPTTYSCSCRQRGVRHCQTRRA